MKTITSQQLAALLDKTKRKLIQKVKAKGFIYENFGQKERRQIEDKYKVVNFGAWDNQQDNDKKRELWLDFQRWIETYGG